MAVDQITQGKKYKLNEPQWGKTIGQGNPPNGMAITINGDAHKLPWGSVLTADQNTPYPFDGDKGNIDFLTEIKNQLKLIPSD